MYLHSHHCLHVLDRDSKLYNPVLDASITQTILITLDVDVPKSLYLSEHHCVLVIIPASCL